MATAKPPARYGAMGGARAGGFATAELHHELGRDPDPLHAGGRTPLGGPGATQPKSSRRGADAAGLAVVLREAAGSSMA
jgi:hypothetical protein